MTSAWAGVLVAALMLTAGLVGWVFRAGRRDGKLDAILERLTDVTEDHEGRLRTLEKGGRR